MQKNEGRGKKNERLHDEVYTVEQLYRQNNIDANIKKNKIPSFPLE